MPDDYSGKVVATVVKKADMPAGADVALLYVHGYNDYFFQKNWATALWRTDMAFMPSIFENTAVPFWKGKECLKRKIWKNISRI